MQFGVFQLTVAASISRAPRCGTGPRCVTGPPCGVGLVVALLLQAWVSVGCGDGSVTPADRPNVLLVVIDTLRADHLHLYGYPRRTSDHIDALGATGWVFERHIASSGQTVPSTLSLLLSMHPAEHGFLHLGYGHFAKNRPRYREGLLFLAEVFAAAGYRTGGFVGNPFLQRENGFAQGFERFVYSDASGEMLTKESLVWLSERDPGSRPFFAYLHYFDVHSPYDPPGEYHDRFERPADGRYVHRNGPAPETNEADLLASVALYDGEIAYVDDQIGGLLAALERMGERENTMIVVTSDHGEEFLDHGGLGHGTSVYGELVWVPLIVAGPGITGSGRRITHLTRHLDLAPTLLALAGIPSPSSFRGGALTSAPGPAFADDGPWLGVYASDRKLILDRKTGDVTTFMLHDTLDQRPLEDPSATRALLEHTRWYAALERAEAAGSEAGKVEWSQEEIERLRALGYAE